MRISNGVGQHIIQAYGRHALDRNDGSHRAKRPSGRQDEAIISDQGGRLSRTRRTTATGDDGRARWVQWLRQRVQEGTYRVDPVTLARRIMEREEEVVRGR